MKNIILSISFCLIQVSLFAQLNLGHEVIANGGGELQSGSLTFSSTLCEGVIQTAQSGDLVLTQGFQQGPQALANNLNEWESLVTDFRVYPLPATEVLYVEVHKQTEAHLQAELTDLAGRRLLGKGLDFSRQGIETGRIEMADLSTGIYLLVLRKEGGVVLHSIKVAKQR